MTFIEDQGTKVYDINIRFSATTNLTTEIFTPRVACIKAGMLVAYNMNIDDGNAAAEALLANRKVLTPHKFITKNSSGIHVLFI